MGNPATSSNAPSTGHPGRLCGRRRPRPTAGAARPPSRVRRSAQLPADPLRRRPQRAWARPRTRRVRVNHHPGAHRAGRRAATEAAAAGAAATSLRPGADRPAGGRAWVCRGPGVPGGSAGRAGVAAGRCRRRACRGSAHGAAADGTDRGCSECGGPPSNWPVASGAGRCSRSLGSRGGRRGCRVGLRRPIRLSAGPVCGAAVADQTNAGRASGRPQLAGGRHGTTRVAVTAANLLGRLPGHAPAAEMVRSQHSSSSTLCPRSRSRQPRARQGHQRGATGAATDGTSIGGARDVARGAVAYLGAVIVTEAP